MISVCALSAVSVHKQCNVEHHLTKVHSNFQWDFHMGSSLRKEKIKELSTTLQRQQSLFTRPTKRANSAMEASFKVAHIQKKNKKPFTDGGTVIERWLNRYLGTINVRQTFVCHC